MSPKAAPTLESYSYDLAETARERFNNRTHAPDAQPHRCVFVGDVLNIEEEDRADTFPGPEMLHKMRLNDLSLQIYAIVTASGAMHEVVTGKSDSIVLHAPMVTCGYDHANKAAKKSFLQPYMEPFRLEVRRWKPVDPDARRLRYVVEVVVSRVEFTQD